jgi:hypothetical protein
MGNSMKLHVARSLLRGLAVNTVIPVGGVYIMRVAQVPDTVGSAAMTVPAYTPVDMDASVNKVPVPLLRPDVTRKDASPGAMSTMALAHRR